MRKILLAALMLGWAPVEPALALIGSTLALTLHFGAARLGAVSPRVIGVAFAGVFALIVAGLIAVLYFTHQITGTAAIILGALAVVFLLTSLISFCPLYLPLGLSTRKAK